MTISRSGRWCWILAGLAWAAHAQGQERRATEPVSAPARGASEATADTESDDVARAARPAQRVLRLSDGRVLRGLAEPTATGWRLSQGGDEWIEFPAALVVSARTEREVRSELDARRRKVKVGDTRAMVELASWMLDNGLAKEALRELDRALTADPDHAEALALLRSRAVEVTWPMSASAEPDRVLAICAGASISTPAAREIAVERLRAEDATAVEARVSSELVSSDPRRRAFATLACRRLFPGKQVGPLQERAVLDSQSDVRHGAARALRDAHDPSTVDRLVENLAHPAGIVRVQAVEALGAMEYRAAVAPLVAYLERLLAPVAASGERPPGSNIFVGRQIAYVQDFDVEVSQNAAIGKPIVNVVTEGSVLDVRILSASQTVSVARERATACDALQKLTHANVGKRPAAWIAWWKKEGSQASDAAHEAPRTETGSSSQW